MLIQMKLMIEFVSIVNLIQMKLMKVIDNLKNSFGVRSVRAGLLCNPNPEFSSTPTSRSTPEGGAVHALGGLKHWFGCDRPRSGFCADI
jgi:hypothetical protein